VHDAQQSWSLAALTRLLISVELAPVVPSSIRAPATVCAVTPFARSPQIWFPRAMRLLSDWNGHPPPPDPRAASMKAPVELTADEVVRRVETVGVAARDGAMDVVRVAALVVAALLARGALLVVGALLAALVVGALLAAEAVTTGLVATSSAREPSVAAPPQPDRVRTTATVTHALLFIMSPLLAVEGLALRNEPPRASAVTS
jgi:hypothetical protein